MATSDAAAGAARGEGALVRALGVRALAATIFNIMIGSGIFKLPASVALIVGAAAPAAYVACAALMGLIVLCFAEAGSRVSLTGGPYAYVEVAFGRFIGFLVGILLWLTMVAANGAVASLLADTMGVLWRPAATPVFRAAIILFLFGLLGVVNVRGVRQSGRLIEAVTVAKLLPLFLLLGAAFFTPWAEPLRVWAPTTSSDFSRAVVALVFAFAGAETALVPSGEVRNPERAVPRALGIAMVGITLLYIALQLVSQGVLGVAGLALAKDAPLVAVAEREMGSWGALVVGVGSAIAMFGNLSGSVLAVPRALYALARDGSLPAPLAAVHPRYRTPHVAIITHVLVGCAFALTGSFDRLLVFAVVAVMLVYLFCCAATLELQRRDVRAGGIPFRVPGGKAVPVLAIVLIVGYLWQGTTLTELSAVGAAMAVAAALYLLGRRRGVPPSPVVP